ncbi:MAG: pyridoxamine kinase [Parasporobacterium sp.]|nr:pyridoxamine kinase [Parasporobacterium sp.]
MSYKRVLSIQDISCVGQCSNTVALPIISACGSECAIIPSAVLSTHTGGFEGFTFKDLTPEIPKICKHWVKEGIQFDAIYTGYLGSVKQIKYVANVMQKCLKMGGPRIVDPAMADNGKLYTGFDEEYVEGMKWLCAQADIILPNITEACLLTDMEYPETYDQDFINELLGKLDELCGGCVILKGVSFKEGYTGVMIYEAGFCSYYEHVLLPNSSHGTGDIFASVFTGALMREVGAVNAACVAADFTVDCIKGTADDPDHWYGVKFEPHLGELIKTLDEGTSGQN